MSHPKWPMVPLGELLERNERIAEIVAEKKYQEVTIRLWGKGVVRRQYVDGENLLGARRFRISSGQFILSRIDARSGAMGVVPHELDNAIVTNDFLSYNVNENRVLPSFIGWLCRTKDFVDLCRSASEGTTNRVRLKEQRFLRMTIGLPTIEIQKQIVAKLGAIYELVDEAAHLRKESNLESEQLPRSILQDEQFGKPTMIKMKRLVTWRRPDTDVDTFSTYTFAGVYCFGRGVFRSTQKSGSEFAYRKLTKLRKNEFVYPKLMAWEGAMGVVPEICDGLFVSPEFPVFTIDEDQVSPEVLDVYFRSPSVWPRLSGVSTGTNVRRRRFNPADFLEYEFPLPCREVQTRLVSIQKKINHVKLQSPATEREAMMPSILDRAFKGEL